MMLLFIPGRADAKIGSPVREHIQRSCCLDQQARITIGDAGNHCSQLDAIGMPGGKRQGAITFQHLVLSRSYYRNLEKMIHDPEAVEASPFRTLCNNGKCIAKLALII
jgi:hypothetical protein